MYKRKILAKLLVISTSVPAFATFEADKGECIWSSSSSEVSSLISSQPSSPVPVIDSLDSRRSSCSVLDEMDAKHLDKSSDRSSEQGRSLSPVSEDALDKSKSLNRAPTTISKEEADEYISLILDSSEPIIANPLHNLAKAQGCRNTELKQHSAQTKSVSSQKAERYYMLFGIKVIITK